MKKRIIVIGGVAGGASCAARVRRNCEAAEVVIYERGPHVSFANCGLPYYIGDIIQDEQALLLATPQTFLDQLRVEVHIRHEVTHIHTARREIETVNLATGERSRDHYDALVLSPGAVPVRPVWPGGELPGIFTLRNIPDSKRIKEWIDQRQAKRAVVVGGGFIGIEMAENLHQRGLHVTLIEAANQVFAPLDPDMAFYVENHLRAQGVDVRLQEAVQAFARHGESIAVQTASGAGGATPGGTYDADLVVIGIGVRPETTLAKEAGLTLGSRGGIQVDPFMQTNDPHIWAVGDAVEKDDAVTHTPALFALAGPAARQGRIAADNICGRKAMFRGSQATSVCGLFGLTAAATGANEKSLRQAGRAFRKIYLHPRDHARYFPGAQQMHLKLLYSEDGTILGAQGVGMAGVDKRIDVIAMTLQLGGTVYDLEEAELSYAPQYGSAKDPVNFAGMVAANDLRGEAAFAHWESLPSKAYLLDVREPGEYAAGHVPGAVNIPLKSLRDRVSEIPADTDVYLYCQVGQRGHYAVRSLKPNGLRVFNLAGGYETYLATRGTRPPAQPLPS